MNFIYSGNFAIDTEVDTRGTTRVLMGINPTDFRWRLEPGESFQTPEAVLVYSDKGLGAMSRTFHHFYLDHLCRSEWAKKKRPLLINSWEAAFFDFDDDKLVAFAQEAKKLGIEMLVMDDGWFGTRNDDLRGLGDWYVNEKKLKGGLSDRAGQRPGAEIRHLVRAGNGQSRQRPVPGPPGLGHPRQGAGALHLPVPVRAGHDPQGCAGQHLPADV